MSKIKVNSIDSINSSDHIQAKQPIDGINQCTAWGVIDGANDVQLGGFNCTMVRTATGKYQVTFDTQMNSIGYSITTTTTMGAAGNAGSNYSDVTVNGFLFHAVPAVGTLAHYNTPHASFQVFGGKS